MSFVHLHLHSEYSLKDGMGKIPDIVKKVKKNGMSACALTDHGVGYGLVEFYDACKSEGIKPILGCEFYIAPDSRFSKVKENEEKAYHHLVILVKNEKGYQNLCVLISRSNTEGFYYKPRIDFQLLKEYHEGLICLSACIAGEVPRAILEGNIEKARYIAKQYKELFGEDYYLEIQNHGLTQEAVVTQQILLLSKELGIKVVATNDCHYVNHADKEAHEWLICMQMGKKLSDTSRMVYKGDYSIKSEEEMEDMFLSVPDAIENTNEVADKCEFELVYGQYRMPKVKIPPEYGENYFQYLSDEAWKGLRKRYPAENPNRNEAVRRLTYELGIVKQMNFAEYFIDTRKTIQWARAHKILVGPGRGSAAGSVMCYCLHITDIDPIKYNLLFERFLNPERVSMPDIDVDYDYAYKDDIVESEAVSNGKDCFAKIQTFGTLQAKGVLRDCARIAGYDAATGTMLSKLIPNSITNENGDKIANVTLTLAWESSSELRSVIKSNKDYQKLWEVALKLEGIKKSASTHACGHIPTPVPCEQLFPVSVDKDSGYLICQYNMTDAEHLGNLKKDLLMLRNLTVINVAQRLIKERHDKEVPLWTDEILNDKETLEMIGRGETDGVFQLESQGMKNFLKELNPQCFEDIIAGVSLYRPGPMDFIPQYISGKNNPDKIVYKTKELEEILSPTYGVIVYQEQVMQIAQKLAKYTMGHADILRKAMGKKKQKDMDAEEPKFILGCKQNNIAEEIARSLWAGMVDFAKYAFNKSHAACYAAVSMQTAYLKRHYPLEFLAGLLSSVMDNPKKLVVYVKMCKDLNVKILPPSINNSEKNFTIEQDSLRYGLMALKDVGEKALDEMLEERRRGGRYKSLSDLVLRFGGLNKRIAEAFIMSGVLDFTGYTRSALLSNISQIIANNRKENKKQTQGQLSLFELFTGKTEQNIGWIPDEPEFPKGELLRMEKEATGMYISGHPLDEYASFIQKNVNAFGYMFVAERTEENDKEENTEPEEEGEVFEGDEVRVAGIVTEVKKIYTKKDKRPMAFATLEDGTGQIPCVIFPDTYRQNEKCLKEGNSIFLCGKISTGKEELSVLAEKVSMLEMIPKKLWIRVNTEEQKNEAIQEIQKMSHSGNDYAILYCADTGEKIGIMVNATISSINQCRVKYGMNNVKITY